MEPYKKVITLTKPYPLQALAKFKMLEITLTNKQVKTLHKKKRVVIQRNSQKLTVTLE